MIRLFALLLLMATLYAPGNTQGAVAAPAAPSSSSSMFGGSTVAREVVTIAAAFTYGDTLYLLTKYHAMEVVNKVEVDFNGFSRSPLYFPNEDEPVQAIYGTKLDSYIAYFKDYGLFLNPPSTSKTLKYGRKRQFLQNGGPDAAGRRDGKVYVFKGCQVAIRHKWYRWGQPQDLGTIGLPCDVDAAWKEQDDMIVLKGNQIWKWFANGTVEGPSLFSQSYTLTHWVLEAGEGQTQEY